MRSRQQERSGRRHPVGVPVPPERWFSCFSVRDLARPVVGHRVAMVSGHAFPRAFSPDGLCFAGCLDRRSATVDGRGLSVRESGWRACGPPGRTRRGGRGGRPRCVGLAKAAGKVGCKRRNVVGSSPRRLVGLPTCRSSRGTRDGALTWKPTMPVRHLVTRELERRAERAPGGVDR